MDHTLHLKFNRINLDNFWLIAPQEYPEISQQAVQIILPFSTTYFYEFNNFLCEFAFSSLSQIKTKSESRLKSVEDELRVCLTSISPLIKTICAQKQAHVSHYYCICHSSINCFVTELFISCARFSLFATSVARIMF